MPVTQEVEVLDLFSGLGGWSAAFRDRGHPVTTLDLDPRFDADFQMDLMDVHDLAELGGPFDIVLASPPCECFSVMTIGRNWNKDRTPKTERAKAALALAWHTFDLIDRYRPAWYVVENPRGMLRKVAPRPPDATTWYCRWGMPYAKPTDLWTNLNGGMAMGWPYCVNRGPDHPYTPRGDKENSVQGNVGKRRPGGRADTRYLRDTATNVHHDRAFRALIPYRLSLAVCLACERDGVLPPMEEIVALAEALDNHPTRRLGCRKREKETWR